MESFAECTGHSLANTLTLEVLVGRSRPENLPEDLL